MGTSLPRNCYGTPNISFHETSYSFKSNRNLLVSQHYSQFILQFDESALKKRKKRRFSFHLKENIENSAIMTRRRSRKTLNN